jgi:cobalt-zinc-cadmium efflux system outer membrane protein
MLTTRPLMCIVLMGAAGCAAVNPRAGLPDVERMVSERGALPVSWPENEEGAKQVEATVSELVSAELTAESAVRIALLNNRNLQAVYQELGVAEADLVQAGLLPNPILTANVRFGLGPSGTGAELGLVQELISALQIPLRKRVAKANLEHAKAEVANAVLELALDTKTAFYRLQGALQLLEVRRSVAAALAISREIAERQRAAGNITDLELSTERALHEEARVELAIAEAQVLADREELNALLGLWGGQTQWTMAPRLPRVPSEEIDPQGLETLAVSQRLDLVATRTQGLSELAQLRLNRFYGLIPSGATGAAAEREIGEGWSLGPALDVPIPVFDQSQALVASAAARLRANDERLRALAVEIRAHVRRARTNLDAARQRAAYYERVVLPLQSRVVQESQRQYNAMQIGPIQLVQTRRDEIEVGRRYVETLAEYWLARTELERAVGGELTPRATPTSTESQSAPSKTHEHHHHHGD